jgi:hypothetical protein
MEFPLRVGIFSTGHIKQKDNNFGLFGDQAISIKTRENIYGNKGNALVYINVCTQRNQGK